MWIHIYNSNHIIRRIIVNKVNYKSVNCNVKNVCKCKNVKIYKYKAVNNTGNHKFILYKFQL